MDTLGESLPRLVSFVFNLTRVTISARGLAFVFVLPVSVSVLVFIFILYHPATRETACIHSAVRMGCPAIRNRSLGCRQEESRGHTASCSWVGNGGDIAVPLYAEREYHPRTSTLSVRRCWCCRNGSGRGLMSVLEKPERIPTTKPTGLLVSITSRELRIAALQHTFVLNSTFMPNCYAVSSSASLRRKVK